VSYSGDVRGGGDAVMRFVTSAAVLMAGAKRVSGTGRRSRPGVPSGPPRPILSGLRLSGILARFRGEGPAAEPVAFRSHRKPEAIVPRTRPTNGTRRCRGSEHGWTGLRTIARTAALP